MWCHKCNKNTVINITDSNNVGGYIKEKTGIIEAYSIKCNQIIENKK